MTETKTNPTPANPPKTDSNANPFASFDPMAAFVASQQAFHKMLADAQTRAQALADEYAQLEAQMIARAKQAIETWAQLAHEALAYSAQLSAEARKLGLDAARKLGVQ